MAIFVKATDGSCPLPPENLGELQIPVYELNLAAEELLRIHRTTYGPVFYTRKSITSDRYRFDAADDEYGVLYASTNFETCMAETVIRGMFQGDFAKLEIQEADLNSRSISRLGCNRTGPLMLADLTQPLFALGGDTRITTTIDNNYATPNKWGSALFAHPQNLDGIYFLSRFTNKPAVAIFDRVKLIPRGNPILLRTSPELPLFLDRFRIRLIGDFGNAWE